MTQQRLPEQSNAQIELLRNRLRRMPNDGHAWFSLAQMLSQGPPGEELFHAIEQSIRSLPENDQVWLLAATVQRRIRGEAAAQQWLEQTARQNPQLTAPQLAIASFLSSSDAGDAIAHYSKLIARFSQDGRNTALLIRLHLERGDLYRQSGLWQKALDDYREIEQSRANDPPLLNNIGCCLAGLENYGSAAEYFEQAIQLKPDFVEARLNVGLLYVSQAKIDEATLRISEVLKEPTVDPATRRSAKTILDVLSEHRRLEPILRRSVRSGSVRELHSALEGTPEKLLQPDKRSVDKLWALAALCRDFRFDPQQFSYSADTGHLPFIEACAQCKVEGGTEQMAELYRQMEKPSSLTIPSAGRREIMNAWRTIRDRKTFSADLLQGADGEAWMRYWHARLLSETPDKLPGHYKAITNAIAHRPLTPPENVAGTFRVLLAEIRPTLPATLARAVFMYMAITLVHGFADGNGRLSRFFLSWEAESAALPSIVIPQNFRAKAARSMDTAWFEGRLDPMVASIGLAFAETDQLLKRFQSKMG